MMAEGGAGSEQIEYSVHVYQGLDCQQCSSVRQIDPLAFPLLESRYLPLHVSISLINPPIKQRANDERKSERSAFLNELVTKTSALRNSRGGAILIHLDGIAENDRCLEYLNELVDVKLNSLIEDGKLFDRVYKKCWLAEKETSYKGCVAVIVLPSPTVVTADFNTKIPLDNSIVDPSNTTIVRFLKDKYKFQDTEAKVRGISAENLQESRCVQVKGFTHQNPSLKKRLLADNNQLCDYIWNDLKLGEYISAFSKIDGGGSYFFGIAEEITEQGLYVSKILSKDGIQLPSEKHVAVKNTLLTLIAKGLLILSYDNQVIPLTLTSVTELIQIAFHETERDGYYVLEIAIAAVNGLVFYDNQGPISYEMCNPSTLTPLHVNEWYSRLMREA